MKRSLFFILAAVLVLVFVASCVPSKPEQESKPELLKETLGVVTVEEQSDGTLAFKLNSEVGAVEVKIGASLAASEITLSDANLNIVNAGEEKTVIAVANQSGKLTAGQTLFTIPKVDASKISTPDYVKAAPDTISINWGDYEKDPDARLLGDLNKDSKVDDADFALFKKYYLSNDSKADIAGGGFPKIAVDDHLNKFFAKAEVNGKVDLYDFYAFAYNYGKAVNRAPVIKSVKVLNESGEDVSAKSYLPAGTYDVEVDAVDYDGNEITTAVKVNGVEKNSFTLDSANSGVTVEIEVSDGAKSDKRTLNFELSSLSVKWGKETVVDFEEATTVTADISYPEELKSTEFTYYLYLNDVKVATQTGVKADKLIVDVAADGSLVFKAKAAGELLFEVPAASSLKVQEKAWKIRAEVVGDKKEAGDGVFNVYFVSDDENFIPDDFKLAKVEGNATVVNDKVWMDGNKHSKLVLEFTPNPTGVLFDKLVFKFSEGDTAIYKTVSEFKTSESSGLVYVEDLGAYFVKYASPVRVDLTNFVKELSTKKEFTFDFSVQAKYEAATLTNWIDPKVNGKSAFYYDAKSPEVKITDVEFVANEGATVTVEATDFSGLLPANKVDLLFNFSDATKTIVSVSLNSAGTALKSFKFIDNPSIPQMDKTPFTVTLIATDVFGQGNTVATSKDSAGKDLFVDTMFKFKEKEPSTVTEYSGSAFYTKDKATVEFYVADLSGVKDYDATVTDAEYKGATLTITPDSAKKVFTIGVDLSDAISDLDGNPITIKFEATDNANNKSSTDVTFYFDNQIATPETFDGTPFEDASITYKTASTVTAPLTLEFATETVKEINLTVEASQDGEYVGDAASTIEFDKPAPATSVSIDLRKLGLVVSNAEATLTIELVDFAGNATSATVTWKNLTTAQRDLFVGWSKGGKDIISFDPQPFKENNFDLDVKEDVPVDNASISKEASLGFIFYATSTEANISAKVGNSINNVAGIDDSNAPTMEFWFDPKTGNDVDITASLSALKVIITSAKNGGDNLKTVATVTFNMDWLIPEPDDYQATIVIDSITGTPKLQIALKKDSDLYKFAKEATITNNITISVGKLGVTDPIDVITKSVSFTTVATDTLEATLSGNYEVGTTYSVRASKGSFKVVLMRGTGTASELYVTNNEDFRVSNGKEIEAPAISK